MIEKRNETTEHPSMAGRRLQCAIDGHFTGPVLDTDPRPLICLVCGDEIVDESIPRHRGNRIGGS